MMKSKRKELIEKHAAPVKQIDLNVSNLPPEANEKSLRDESGSKHIVSVKTDVNNLTNRCTGTGKISIRSNSQDERTKVKSYLRSKGYTVTESKPKFDKKNNYIDTKGVSWANPDTTIETSKSRKDVLWS